jgi:ribonucleotide monophosphatase NagD (HAD superfamily)
MLLSASAREEIVAKSQLLDGETPSVVTLYDSVVVGLAPSSFDYANLNVAFRIIKGETKNPLSSHKTIPLIATHKAKYVQRESGLLSLGPGPFVTALEDATGVKATVVGKPTKKFFETVINNFSDMEVSEFGTGRIAVIGDDIEADLGEGAVELNLWRILGKHMTTYQLLIIFSLESIIDMIIYLFFSSKNREIPGRRREEGEGRTSR